MYLIYKPIVYLKGYISEIFIPVFFLVIIACFREQIFTEANMQYYAMLIIAIGIFSTCLQFIFQKYTNPNLTLDSEDFTLS